MLPRPCLRAPLRAAAASLARALSTPSAGATGAAAPRILEVRERGRGIPSGALPATGAAGVPHGAGEGPPIDVTAMDVFAAAQRIRQGDGGVKRTSMYHSKRLSAMLGMEIHLKTEISLPTGSFKERGALNALLTLSPEARAGGVIAASAGNHALALAYHGQRLGIKVTVVMPTIAPITKVQNCRDLGAEVVVAGAHIGEARERAYAMAGDSGASYINGFDHPAIIAGAGSMGIEIAEQCPDADAVIVPVGGGGLIAGVGIALQALMPNTLVIGAEPSNCPSLSAALAAGHPVTVPAHPTLADGLMVPRVGGNAYALAARTVHSCVLAGEKHIALAMLRLLECEKLVVEGGGATGLAVLLAGTLPQLKGKRVVLPLCGGNVDTPVLGRVLERALAADERLVRFEALVSDRPGGVAALTKVLAECGVSIKDIFHERAWVSDDAWSVRVKVVVETADRAAGERMFAALKEHGYDVGGVGK